MKRIIKYVIVVLVIFSAVFTASLMGCGSNGCAYSCGIVLNWQTETFTSTSAVTKIDLDTVAGEFEMEFYEGEHITIEYPTADRFKYFVKETNGTVVMGVEKDPVVAINWSNCPTTIIKIPQNLALDIKIETDAGKIIFASGNYGKIEVDLDAGKATFGEITCSDFNANVNAGKVYAQSVTCNNAYLDADAGSIEVKKMDSVNLTAQVDMGEIEICMAGAKTEYTIFASVSLGDCNVANQSGNTQKKINLEVDLGEINVSFTD